ncbi:hypothetical protein L328_0124050 [Yersinia pestis 24H]|nr:hypothetical protein L328_0124050 [Yersinia pestis 24H]
MMMLTVWDQQPLKKATLLAASAFFCAQKPPARLGVQ